MGKNGWQDAEEYEKVGELMGRLEDESSVAVRLSVILLLDTEVILSNVMWCRGAAFQGD